MNRQKGILFFLAFSLLGLPTACSKTDEEPQDPGVDVAQINAGATAAEQAFLSGDPAKVLATMTEEAATRYKDRLASIKDQLPAFGEAFKSRTLNATGDHYAEYTFTSGGKTYSVALAKDEDDKPWKIIRF
jgi:hypothetical protein